MTISALPDPPSRSDPANFATKGDAFLGALPQFGTQANALAVEVNALEVSATSAANSANASKTLAEAAAASASLNAGVTQWVSGTTYADGAVTWSPTDYQTYRRKGAGGGTTDPVNDTANWARVITLNPALNIYMHSTYGGF